MILWVPSDTPVQTFGGNDGLEDKESWRPKHMCRSSGAEIYDLAWSPDGQYFIIGSMDNVARIYSAGTGVFTPTTVHSEYQQKGQSRLSNPITRIRNYCETNCRA